MSRLSEAILKGDFSKGQSPMLDIRYGGQMGYAPNLSEFVSHQSYIRRNLVCLLIEAPTGFQYLPEPTWWVSALKSMVEVHAKSIDGFAAGLTVTTFDNAVSGGGELQQDPTNVTRERSNPSFTFVEKYGRPIQSFIHEWITNLIMDPDSKVPNVSTLPGVKPEDLLADVYGATMLFFEPDPTFTTISKAWLTTNMYPLLTGEITGKRDLTAPGEELTLSINFSGLSQSTLGVRAFAQTLLDSINITNANPHLRPAFVQKINDDVAAATQNGYKAQAETLGSTSITRK